MKPIVLILPGHVIPSWNVVSREHWSKTRARRKADAHEVWAAKCDRRRTLPEPDPPPGRRRVTITSYRRRLIDVDNLSAKAIVDSLRDNRLLVDDSPEWVEAVTVEQFKIAKGETPRTVVTIEDANKENRRGDLTACVKRVKLKTYYG